MTNVYMVIQEGQTAISDMCAQLFTVKSAWMMTPIFIFQVTTVIKKVRPL